MINLLILKKQLRRKLKINRSNVNLLDRQVETDRIRLERGNISLSDGNVILLPPRIVQPLHGEAGGGASLHPVRHVRDISVYRGSSGHPH